MPEEPFQSFRVGGVANQIVGPVLASATTLASAPSALIHHVSGTTAIATIPVPYAGFAGMVILIPDAIFTWTAGGNIALAGTAVVNKALVMVYDPNAAKWHPSYIA